MTTEKTLATLAGAMRKSLWIAVAVGAALVASPALAVTMNSFFAGSSIFDAGNMLVTDDGNYVNTDSGWFRNDGVHNGGNTDYITGFCAPDDCGGYYYHSFFSFDLGSLSAVTSASFTVNSYAIQFVPGTFLLYGTDLAPADVDSAQDWNDTGKFDSLILGPLVGSLSVTPADSSMYVSVTFNQDGLDWLNSHAGGTAVLGGDFQAIPEPVSMTLMLLGMGMLGVGRTIRRRRG